MFELFKKLKLCFFNLFLKLDIFREHMCSELSASEEDRNVLRDRLMTSVVMGFMTVTNMENNAWLII